MLDFVIQAPTNAWGYIVHSPQSRRTLWFGSVMHIWSDLHFALMFPLLPLIQSDMGLSFTQVGILRATYSGASAVLQIPAGFLAENMGEFWLLLAGNMWVSVGLVGMALAPMFVMLVVLSFFGGLGGGFQHPLASSMVSRAYDDSGRSTAVGTVNFAGDLGKMIAPPIVAGAIAISMGWRQLLWVIGLASLVFMAAAALTRRAVDIGRPVRDMEETDGGRSSNTRLSGFATLSGIGALDSMARVGALTFLPFVLISKDVSQSQAISMLLFVFIGGAAGKFVVGWLGDRFSTVSLVWATKGLTAVLDSVGAVCADDGDDPAAGAAGGRAERHIFNSVRDGGGVCAGEQAWQILWVFLHYERDRHGHCTDRVRIDCRYIQPERDDADYGRGNCADIAG